MCAAKPARNAQIVEAWLAGVKQEALAAEHGVSCARISRVVKRAGHGLARPGKPSPSRQIGRDHRV